MRALSRSLVISAVAVLAAGAGFTVAIPAASAITVCDTSWTNPGTGGGWNTAGDWTNGVPTADKVACLGASTTPYEVVALGGANAAKGVVIGSGATLTLEGEEEDLDVALTVGSGGITNSGGIEMTSVNSSQNATLSVAAGAKLNNSGTLQADAGAGGNRFIHAAVVNTGSLNVNTNVVMNAALTNSFTNGGNTIGTINVAADKLLYAPTLTNYSAKTHTLNGGVYELNGTLAVPNLDVRTLNAAVDLLTPTAELQNAPHTNGLLHLATLSPSIFNHLTLSGSLSVGPVSVGCRLKLNGGANLTSTGAVTVTLTGNIQMFNGSTVKSAKPLVNHGSISGTGTINGSVQNAGSFQPQSNATFDVMKVTGNFTQASTGALIVLWNGHFFTTPVNVGGTATLAGYLFLVQANTAGNGLTLPLITANKRTGTFGETSFVVFTDGTRPLPTYFAKGVNVQATSPLQQDDLRVGYQGWVGVPDPGVGGYTRDSNTPGDAISYTFTGKAVDVDFNAGPDRGKAQITIDGKSKGTLDMYAPTLSGFASKTYGGLKNVKHTVTVSVTGTKNAQSSDSIVSLLGFRANGFEHDLAAPAVNVAGWKKTASAAASFGSYVSATAAGKRVTVPFSGTGIDWVTQTCKACGKASVSVDGGVPTTVDLYSATTRNQVAEPFRNLAPGNHTITITVLGSKRSAATGTAVVVDSFVVHP